MMTKDARGRENDQTSKLAYFKHRPPSGTAWESCH